MQSAVDMFIKLTLANSKGILEYNFSKGVITVGVIKWYAERLGKAKYVTISNDVDFESFLKDYELNEYRDDKLIIEI